MKKDFIYSSILLILFALMLTSITLNSLPEKETRGPERIISLGPFITEELYLLGVQDRLIACTTFCTRPAAARQKPRVSNAVRPNIERILSLKPDLVLVPELIDTRALRKMKALGLTVKTFPVARSFSEICEIFLEIGTLVNKREKAKSIVSRARQRVNTLHTKIKGLPPVRVFMQIGANPLFTVIKNTFMDDYISLIGGINIADSAASGIFSREEVIRRNPHVILIVTMGNIHLQEKRTWMFLKK